MIRTGISTGLSTGNSGATSPECPDKASNILNSSNKLDKICPSTGIDFNPIIDKPYKVSKVFKHKNRELSFLIEFEPRSNGILPSKQKLKGKYLNENYPDFLINFYSNLVFKKFNK